MARVVAVIPARYGSTRFPGKVLADLCGKPMIQWVYEKAQQTDVADIIVATDDERVRAAVEGFGGRVVMTRTDHPTGTDRIAEAVAGVDADWILNIQGDEPLVPPSVLNELMQSVVARDDVDMGTVAVPFADDSPKLHDPNVVKCVMGADNRALYFSRAPIPYARGPRSERTQPLHHWGIYLYRRRFLEQFVTWPQGELERCESLEQLRAVEHGVGIHVHISHLTTIGVDTPADLVEAEAAMRASRSAS